MRLAEQLSNEQIEELTAFYAEKYIYHLYRISLEQFIESWQRGEWRDWV